MVKFVNVFSTDELAGLAGFAVKRPRAGPRTNKIQLSPSRLPPVATAATSAGSLASILDQTIGKPMSPSNHDSHAVPCYS